jgi:glutathione peroxidase
VYDFTAVALYGTQVELRRFAGQVLLIVNTASACGFTPQYAQLEELHRRFASRGFSVLGFPCNQFGRQEPGSAAEIGAFCSRTYGVTFPLFARIEVNGAHAHPLFAHLKSRQPGALGSKAIKWNFTKFLIDRYGEVTARYGSVTAPAALIPAIEKLL